jgi:hypothetical protein
MFKLLKLTYPILLFFVFYLLIPTVHMYLEQLFSKSDAKKESFGFSCIDSNST